MSDEWKPIDSAPRDERRILVADSREMATAGSGDLGDWYVSPTAWEGGELGGLTQVPFEPTHWMPLPAPPSG